MDDARLLIGSILAGLAGVALACMLIAMAGVVMMLLKPLPDAPDFGGEESNQ